MTLSAVKRRANPLAQRLALLGETTITTPVTDIVTTPVTDLEGLQELITQCAFVYGSGGVSADFFLQSTFDNGTTWTDIAAFRFPGVTGRLATEFDGTNDYYARGSGLTGAVDGKLGTVSAWVRIDGGDGDFFSIIQGDTNRFIAGRANTNKFRVFGRNITATTVLNASSVGTYTATGTWLNLLTSWDLGNAKFYMYIDDASVADTPTTLIDDDLDYTRGNYGVGADYNGIRPLNGALSELYFSLECIDLSVESNRRLFISAAGHPVPLGADGSTPTSTQPIIYARDGDASDNLGSGGDFTAVGSPTSTPGPNVEDTRFQAIKTAIATAANQSNQDGAMDPNSIIDGCLGSQLRVKYSTTGVFAGGTTIKIDAITRG